LWLSDSAIRIGVARGSGGEGAEGSSPTLPPCGQLTRCLSAVAELLVGAGFCPKKIIFCSKNMALSDPGGCAPVSRLVRL